MVPDSSNARQWNGAKLTSVQAGLFILTGFESSSKTVRVSTSDFFRSIGRNALGLRMLLSVFLTVSLYLAIFAFGNEDSLYWPGWYILRLGPKEDVERIEKALRDMGVEEVISGVSAKVTYMAIPNLERFSVVKLEEYLLPGDPRRDPYISNVSRLFESSDSPLIYIQAKRRLFYYKVILERQEVFSGWELMDWRGVRALISPLILIGVTLLIALLGSARGRRLVRLASTIPLGIFALLTTQNTLIPIILVFYLSPNALSVRSRPHVHQIVIYFGYTIALASIFLIYDEMYLPLLAVLVSELIYLILSGTGGRLTAKGVAKRDGRLGKRMTLRTIETPNPEHRLFDPVPLSLRYKVFMPNDINGTAFSSFKIGRLLLAALVFLVFLIPEPAPISHDPLPYARKSTKDFDDIGALELLDANRSPTDLPDISLLMASAAYQEGFLFGAVFHLPKLNESLVMRTYLQADNAIKTVENTVIEYNQAWYRQRLSEQLESGVGKLFASLDGPSPVSMVTTRPVSDWCWIGSLTAILWSISFVAIFILALISDDVAVHRGYPIKPSSGKRTRIL